MTQKHETARAIVDQLLVSGPVRPNPATTKLYREHVALMGELRLVESPQLHDSPIVYMSDAKFTPTSLRNFGDYILLDRDDQFSYVAHPDMSFGYVFDSKDVAEIPSLGLFPVLRLQLRDSSLKGYKQAFRLRIRESYAKQGVASNWYFAYVAKIGGIVSDTEHLEGGKRLWKSFVRTAADRGLRISLVDTASGTWTPVDGSTPDDVIWTTSPAGKLRVLVLEKGN